MSLNEGMNETFNERYNHIRYYDATQFLKQTFSLYAMLLHNAQSAQFYVSIPQF